MKFLFVNLVLICFISCASQNLKYGGVDYEYNNTLPISFGKDTVYADIWIKGLNVDGDIKRIIAFNYLNTPLIFRLPDAVNNYTTGICYFLQVDKKNYLWVEDNFGTIVFDIGFKKVKQVLFLKKKLSELTESGTHMGVRKDFSELNFRSSLKLKSFQKLKICDSLNFEM